MQACGIPLIEDDQLHSEDSTDAIANDTPLADERQILCLEAVKAKALFELNNDEVKDIIVTFSSLNRSNRDELRKIRSIQTVFLMLEGGLEIICHRGGNREGHSIGAETVETPDIDETDLIPIDATGDRDEVLAEVLGVLKSA